MQVSGEECSVRRIGEYSEAGEFLTCVRINKEARKIGVE